MALQLIGAGFGRTGTLSQKSALEQLGVGRCYHMVEAMANPQHTELWSRAADAGTADWEAVFEGFGATVDWPACRFWRQLAAHYPDAPVLLSVRDPDRWFDSASATIFQAIQADISQDSPAWSGMEMVRKIVGADLGDPNAFADRALATRAFERHNEAVKSEIPADRLLVYEVSQGWEPLCALLGVPVPDVDFPRVNTTEEFQGRMKAFASAPS